MARPSAATDEAVARAEELLAPDESVVSALCVTYGGKVNVHQTPRGLVAGAADEVRPGVMVGEGIVKRYQDQPPLQFPAAPQMIIVLTSKRLLCWSRGGLKGRPKAFLGDVPLSSIAEVRREEGRYQDRLVFVTRSEWEVTLEAQRGSSEEFAEAVRAHLG